MNSYLYYFKNKKVKKFTPGGTLTPEEEAEMNRQALQSATNPSNSYINPNQLQSIAAMPAPNIQTAMQKTQDDIKSEFDKKKAEEQAKVERASSLAQRYGIDEKYIGEGKGQMNAKGAAAVGVLSDVGIKALDTLDNGLMGDKNFGAQSAAIDSAVNGASDALIKSGNPYAAAAGIALKGANFLTKAGGQTTEGYDVNIDNSGYGNLAHQDASSSRDFATVLGLGGLNSAKQDAKLARRNEQAQMAMKAANISDDIKFEQEARMNSVDDVLRQNQIALAGGLDSSLLAAKKGGKLNTKNLVTTKRVHPKEVIDEKGNKIKVPKKLSDAQQRGAQPFIYNGKHYYLNGDGKTCISLKNTVKQNKQAVHGFCRGGRVIYEAPVYQPVKILEAPPLQEDVWGEILKAQNGARLQQIEVSEESNVLPSGELHKNKHDDFGIDVTKKGIPVITVADDSVETLQEIQNQADTVVQHAEVEKEEVIFNKELTDFVESMRAKWHDSNEKDEDCLLQVGMRVAKEMIENTDDNANLMNKLDTK